MPSSEILDTQVVSGISLGFSLIFFAPLALVALCFLAYSLFAKRSVVRFAKTLSFVWLVACIPAALMILMGFAFNSNKLNPLLSIPLWVLSGLALLWLPVGLRALLRIKPL